jgi:hypothetical protein
MLRYALRFHKKNPKKIPPKNIFTKKFQKNNSIFFVENQKTVLPKLLRLRKFEGSRL